MPPGPPPEGEVGNGGVFCPHETARNAALITNSLRIKPDDSTSLYCVGIDFWMAAQRLPILSQNRNIKHRRLLETVYECESAVVVSSQTRWNWALSSNLQIREPPQKGTEVDPVDGYVKRVLFLRRLLTNVQSST